MMACNIGLLFLAVKVNSSLMDAALAVVCLWSHVDSDDDVQSESLKARA